MIKIDWYRYYEDFTYGKIFFGYQRLWGYSRRNEGWVPKWVKVI